MRSGQGFAASVAAVPDSIEPPLTATVVAGVRGREAASCTERSTAAGQESALYDQVKPVLNDPDPLRWSPGFASIAWRLHPPQSIGDFRTRALSTNLDLAARKAAVTAIGFNTVPAA